ncbi:unsaturated chondroitin disaccharide hydrolase [Paenibacillus aquistagni]|uniref:Unsaturated chondroitin disaccharide hydrolase n=2 Tax=Paenibacillus aquistagni TaxID=1852522 RepID=A0A1X7JLH9_9BACL|nr:unsaturated chondroitin disaccharide hydrolase [Paenibacillus aquistagni]
MEPMWKSALDDIVSKTKANIARFGNQFPHVSKDDKYLLNDNTDWTDGFWSGILWLCYEYTKDPVFAQAASQTVDSFRERLQAMRVLDHHDIGFLYSLSAKAQWMIQQDEKAKKLAIDAADALLARWREDGQYIQAWGSKGDAVNGGRIIIDCLMNLPLLYWASEQTGDVKYAAIAHKHAELSRRYLVRGDDSSYHTFVFDEATGAPIGGSTHQGYTNGSTWTRGQAWGVYGFALSYRYTKQESFLETSRRLAHYFIDHLPEDQVAYWDFDAPIETATPRDSSASAIVAAGLQELLEHLPEDHVDREKLTTALHQMVHSLIVNYSTVNEPDAEGLLQHGSYSVQHGNSPDDYMIWGDYYYTEALMRLVTGTTGYWYEREAKAASIQG